MRRAKGLPADCEFFRRTVVTDNIAQPAGGANRTKVEAMNDSLSQLLSRLMAQGGGTPQQIGAQYGWPPQQIQQTGLLGPGAQTSVFDAKTYLANNADVQQAWNAGNPWGKNYATPEAWAQAHYSTAGQREGRAYPTMMVDANAPQATQTDHQAQIPPAPPAQPYAGDPKTYGQGPEHMWFGGLNGQPYGLTSFTGSGYRPQGLGSSQFDQLMAAINGMRTNPNMRGLLDYFGADGGSDGGGPGSNGSSGTGGDGGGSGGGW